MTSMSQQHQQHHRWTSSNSESSSGSSVYRRRPLHSNPSRIESAIGSIYRPPDFFLGINDPVEEDGDDAGYDASLFLPEDDKILSDSIGSCIKVEDDDDENGNETRCATDGRNTEMSVCFLGTGAGSPACSRSTSGTLLKLFGTNYLFDAGEGIQRQLQFARGRNTGLQKIDKIFITHMHGDHIFGLPGLLLSLQTSYMQHKSQMNNGGSKKKGRKDNHSNDDSEEEQANVKIYGPPGLFNYIASSITLSCTKLHSLNVEVYELVGGRVRKSTTPPPSYGCTSSSNSRQHPLPRITQKNIRDPFHDDYLEYYHYGGRIKRIRVPCKNGIWDIQDVEPIKKEDIINQKSAPRTRRFSSLESKRHKRIHIKAAEVDHLPGVATFGYVVLEDGPPHNLDVEKARSLGVSHKNMNYDLLKYGFPVIADMNSNNNNNNNNNDDIDDDASSSLKEEQQQQQRIVYPHEAVKSTTNKKARKIAFIGDNRGWTREMTNIARNADVLIHEATLLEKDYNVREIFWKIRFSLARVYVSIKYNSVSIGSEGQNLLHLPVNVRNS
jgi:ribonuclease BN (tRNA processing enzyme)